MQRLNGVLGAIWVFLLVFATTAWSHTLNFSGVRVQFTGTKTMVSVVAHLDNFKTTNPATDIPRRLKLRIDGQPFVPSQPQLIRDKANGIVMWQAQAQTAQHTAPSPKAPPEVAIDAPIFPEIAGDRTVVTVFHNRQVFAEAVVNAEQPTAVLGAAKDTSSSPASQVVPHFVHEGIAHIFGGFDHILFLLSLLLLGGGLRQILKIVTAFTLAHSITLSLATTGVLTLPPRLVEPVIALSIVVVAVSNLWRAQPESSNGPGSFDIRPWMAFGFGLIHGFGFAGALAEADFPRQLLGWVLVSFNVGVEIGQVALVLLFAPTLAGITKKWPTSQRPIIQFGSASVALVGAFWFVQRAFTA